MGFFLNKIPLKIKYFKKNLGRGGTDHTFNIDIYGDTVIDMGMTSFQ